MLSKSINTSDLTLTGARVDGSPPSVLHLKGADSISEVADKRTIDGLIDDVAENGGPNSNGTLSHTS
mgnify:CR=1 FL=1